MITALNQRWRDRRDSYRPIGEPIRTADYDVGELPDVTRVRTFVERHHYSKSLPSSVFRAGLFRHGELVGVANFSTEWAAVLRASKLPAESLTLGRFVLLDDVPANGETWFLARAFELLRAEGLAAVMSFSDPMPRATADGRRVFAGHIGNIYQAFNARYRGRSARSTKYLLPDGTLFENRCTGKVRAGERGFRYARQLLERVGAAAYDGGDRTAWLHGALDQVARRVRHPGNHRYVWPLNRRVARHLPEGLPYPKFDRRLAA